ncbi:MAG: UDP-N-acetylglucosamine 1-carboxyvinyltransferase [bacterium]
MDKFVIEGGKPLDGEIKVFGAKNAILPMMAGAILSEGKTIIRNVPNIRDVSVFIKLLEHLGASCFYNNHTLEIDTTNVNKTDAPYELVCQMRAGFLVAAPLLARLKKACVSFPGGCALGARNIDIHLKGFEKFGAKIKEEGGYITLSADKLKGCEIYLDYPTHTGTENLIMAGVLADGKTIIENCAKEPEIVDFALFLKKMGAKIEGEGSSTIIIDGVSSLVPCEYSPIPDRIEAGTFLITGAITKGRVFVQNAIYEHMRGLIAKMSEMGVIIKRKDSGIEAIGKERLKATNVITGPYPSFSTDLQPLISSLMCIASGTSIVKETVFNERTSHIFELSRMGAKIRITGSEIIIEGVKNLSGVNIMASDIRQGAALVLAALSASGKTIIDRVYHIDRGYECLEERLVTLGASITRIKE